MKIHHFTATCDVCGEPGAATASTASAAWLPDSHIAHTDSRVCRANIEWRRDQEAKEAKERLRFATGAECYGAGYEIGLKADPYSTLPDPQGYMAPDNFFHGMRAALGGRGLDISPSLMVIKKQGVLVNG